MKSHIALSFISLGVLTACGGGSGGSSNSGGGGSSSTPTVTETAEVTTPAQENAETRKTSELVVPDDFNYDPTDKLTVDVDISALTSDKAYLSVYSEFDEQGGDFKPDYRHRVSGTPLANGKASMELTFPSQNQVLLAEVWFFDGSEPLQKLITVDDPSFYY